MMFSLPSPLPTAFAIGTDGGLNPALSAAPPPPPPELPPLSPHAATTNVAAHAATPIHTLDVFM
jgi:hypothetical protein